MRHFIPFFVSLIFVATSACSSGGGGGSAADKTTPDGETPANIKNAKAYNPGPALLFGDSIARGVGASSELKSLVGCMLDLQSELVSNMAQEGATTPDALKLLDSAIDTKPSIVLISLGGNDLIVDAIQNDLPEKTTLDGLRKIFRDLVTGGSLVIHLGLNPPADLDFPIELDTSRLGKIKAIAVEEGVLFIENSFEGMWGNPEYMSDSVHPNDAGYALVCQRIQKAVAPHLK